MQHRFILALPYVCALLCFYTAQAEIIRIVASNTTSGNQQSYEAPGERILQALQADIYLMQEFQLSGSTSGLSTWVTSIFGNDFTYVVEPDKGIPNGVISRYPIIDWGIWDDPNLGDREFVWTQIDIPGDIDLWAVSVHLHSSGGATSRAEEASALVNYVNNNIPAGDYLVLGGDFNTNSRTENAINNFSSILVTSSPYPVSENGDDGTNASRSKPYDWVLVDSDLDAYEVPYTAGTLSYPNGLVFDTTEYSQSELNANFSPALTGDSNASNMQHMAVARAFDIPATSNQAPIISQGASTSVTMSENATPTPFNLSLNATDGDGDTLTWSISASNPAQHAQSLALSPSTGNSTNVLYTPQNNYFGNDNFTVVVSDGNGGTDSILVNVTIEEVVLNPRPRLISIQQNGFLHTLTYEDANATGLLSKDDFAFHRSLNLSQPGGGFSIIAPGSTSTTGNQFEANFFMAKPREIYWYLSVEQ